MPLIVSFLFIKKLTLLREFFQFQLQLLCVFNALLRTGDNDISASLNGCSINRRCNFIHFGLKTLCIVGILKLNYHNGIRS